MAQRLKLAIAVLLTGVVLMGYIAVSSGAATPTATPVPVKYVVKGAPVGWGLLSASTDRCTSPSVP